MIAFGCSIILPDAYVRHARPGIELAAESDSAILALAASGSIARSYNLMLDRAAALDELEAIVLVHEDAEIVDPECCAKMRRALADPEVAVVGCVGAIGVGDIAWWDGAVTWNSAPYHYGELGGGQLLFRAPNDPRPRPGEVDTVYGVMMAFSPWAVRNLRFDESIGLLHGYDADICRRARLAGRKVVTADIGVAHHHSLDVVGQIEIWVAAHMRAAELWDTGGPDDPDDEVWKTRARRAEASAAAARLLAASKLLQADASAHRQGSELSELLASRSWRITEPLRRGNAIVKAARRRVARSSLLQRA
jgi:Glycosyltransferase like family